MRVTRVARSTPLRRMAKYFSVSVTPSKSSPEPDWTPNNLKQVIQFVGGRFYPLNVLFAGIFQ